MDVKYHYGDVLVVICYTIVRFVVSGSLSIVDVVLAVEFVSWSVESPWWEIARL